MWPGTIGLGCGFGFDPEIAACPSLGVTFAMRLSTTLEPIGEPKPVVASQPVPAEYPITVTGLLDESNSSAELVPVVMS